MIRELRKADAARLLTLMEREFPEESALLGNRPEEFTKVVSRVFRWDSRILLGLLRLFGRPIFRALVVEVDGHLVATAFVTFPAVSSYVSNVVVDPAHRRRGYAKQLLEEALRTAQRAHRKYIALDVLETNVGARALYDAIGYKPLRARTQYVHDAGAPVGPPPRTDGAVRPLRRSDADPLAEVARRQTPPAVEEVLPTEARMFAGSRLASRMLSSEEAAWVVDRGHGPEGYVGASVSRVFEAANLSAPVLSESVDPELTDALVRTAMAWCAERKALRVLSMVADDNARGRAALGRAGFRHAFPLWTLYRPVD